MADVALPTDLLLMIMEISPRSAISKTMRTCRTLYHSGARLLIANGVSISTSEEAISFLRFMLADVDARFPHLHSLELSRGNFARAGVHALRGLLNHNYLALKTLILLDAEAILSSESAKTNISSSQPSLFMALANLQSLKNLTIDGCDVTALSLLRLMSACLETVTLNLGMYTSWSSIISPDDRNPIPLLIQSSQTLREIRGSYFDSNPVTIKFDVVYPSVRLISASYASMWMPATLAYIHAFPNLESLSLTSDSHRFEGNGADPNSVPHLFSNRECNMHDQENYGVTWEHLQEVAGSVVDLFVLGLICHVPTVRVLDDISERMCRFLHDVIADTKPQALVVTVAGSALFAPGGSMNVVLRQPAAQYLRNLELELCFAPQESDASLDAILRSIRDTFVSTGIPLESLVLTLNHGLLTTPRGPLEPSTSAISEHQLCPLERELTDMDPIRARRVFSDAIPSLQHEHVSIRLSTEREPHQYMSEGNRGLDSADEGESSDSESYSNGFPEDFARFMIEEEDVGW